MTEPHITLLSCDLLSKWGFNDGDDPEAWLDWCDEHGVDHNELEFPWAALVREHLVPLIDQAINVVDVETIHNPIRVDTVDGVDVIKAWSNKAPAPTLTPESVDVPMAAVLRLALHEAGRTEAPRYQGPSLD